MTTSIYCPYCHKHTHLRIAPAEYEVGGFTYSTHAAWKTKGKQGRQIWWIGICNACQQPVLVLGQGDKVFPQPLPSPTDPHVPEDLAKDLDEAKMCLAVQCHRACAVMARRCIQNACIAKGAKAGSNLVEQIAELTKTGVITKNIEEWATVVRWVGNDAAHPGKDSVTKNDAETVLKLAEQFMHVLFVTPAIAEDCKTAKGK